MNSKTKTTLIIIACVLAVALIAWLIWKMLHENDVTSGTETTAADEFPLQEGSKGDKVRILQQYLNTQLQLMQTGEVRYTLLTVDGIFGPNTATACKIVFGTETISKSQFNEI